jgi:magnesium transporter
MTAPDSAVYVDGKRAEEPRTLTETHEAARERGGVVWIGLSWPAEKQFQAVAQEFGLHELAVEGAGTRRLGKSPTSDSDLAYEPRQE